MACMRKRPYGDTGIEVSPLSYGAMRLPCLPKGGGVDFEKAIAVLHRAFERGVNLVDSSWGYHGAQSELAVGRALDAWKGHRVYVQTKAAYYRKRSARETDRGDLEEQRRRLGGRVIDFYLMHSLDWKKFKEHGSRWLAMAEAAKAAGEIGHIGFSVHAEPGNVVKLIDTGAFEVMVIQYNLLDRRFEGAIAHAREKGLGVAVMGPIAGGRLAAPSEVLAPFVPGDAAEGTAAERNAELALRFVLANRNVSTAMSGMTTIEMVNRNADAAVRGGLSHHASESLLDAVEKRKPLHDTGCTGCGYCKPCSQKIQIPSILGLFPLYHVWGLEDAAREKYARFGQGDWMGPNATACTECGECLERCPQNLNIPELLRGAHALLGAE